MKEIKVVCLCRAIRIEDLKLNLVLGDEIILSQEAVKGSSCLNQAHRAKAVQLTPIERFRDRRDPTVPEKVFRPTPYRPMVPALVAVNEERPVMDEDTLAEKIRKLVVGDVARLIEQMGGIEVVREHQAKGILVEDNTSTFIPTGLVSAGAQVDLKATETTQSDEGLNAAAAALKKRRTRKPKEETHE